MKIILNGTEKTIAATTLKSLIDELCRNPQYVIAELNGSIVKSPAWDKQPLKDGDHLELVNFVGGG